MTPIKINGKIFGAKLTKAEQKALDIEARKAFAEYDRKNENELDAIALYILMSEFDFTVEDARRFHNSYIPTIDALCERYEMTDKDDDIWLCTHKLKEHGVDIEQWNKDAGIH